MKTYKVWENFHWILYWEISCHILTHCISHGGMILVHNVGYSVKFGFANYVRDNNNEHSNIWIENLTLLVNHYNADSSYLHRIA